MKNNLKTAVLLGGLGSLFVLIGRLFLGGNGIWIGGAIGIAMVGASYWFSDKLALRSAHAQVVTEAEAPEFVGMVRRLAEKANMPMPRVAISPNMQPNAFATGRNPKNAVVCATQGLLQAMPYDELEGVMAHELMHVKNRDILTGSVAAAIGTGISMIANFIQMAAIFGGGSSDDDRPNPIALLAISIVGPMAAGVIQMAISRSREFEADADAARLIGSGVPLANALRRIEQYAKGIPMNVNPNQASAWIHNPLAEASAARKAGGIGLAKLFSTHPPTEVRIERLLAMR
jgi:heat shock protein HtpX